MPQFKSVDPVFYFAEAHWYAYVSKKGRTKHIGTQELRGICCGNAMTDAEVVSPKDKRPWCKTCLEVMAKVGRKAQELTY